MKIQYILGFLAIAIVAVAVETQEIVTVTNESKPYAQPLIDLSKLPQHFLVLQTIIQNINTRAHKDVATIEKEIKTRNSTLIKHLLDENKSKHSSLKKNQKNDVMEAQKRGDPKSQKKIGDCVKKENKQAGVNLDHHMQTGIECIEEATKNALEKIEQAKKNFDERSFSSPKQVQLMITEWTKCMLPQVILPCLEKNKKKMEERIKVAEQESTTLLDLVNEIGDEHKSNTYVCVGKCDKEVQDTLKHYSKAKQKCSHIR